MKNKDHSNNIKFKIDTNQQYNKTELYIKVVDQHYKR